MDTTEVTDLDMAFGGKAMAILPPMSEIPDEFKRFRRKNKWVNFVSDAFFRGIASCQARPKQGTDAGKVWRMFRACLVDYEPAHEHKTAGCAYMLSCFFDDIKWKPGTSDSTTIAPTSRRTGAGP